MSTLGRWDYIKYKQNCYPLERRRGGEGKRGFDRERRCHCLLKLRGKKFR